MRHNTRSIFLAIGSVLISGYLLHPEANAITTYTEKVICPLNGNTTDEMKYASYNFVGRRLDTKAILLGSPQVLPLPVCKENGFVIYKNMFNQGELKKALKLVKLSEFKIASKIHTNHYMAAIEAEHLGENQFYIARLYLTASWEAEENEKKHLREYMIKSLEYFQIF